jgi:hypothetical protein
VTAFKRFDASGKGKIDSAQLSQLLKLLNVEPTSDRIFHAMVSPPLFNRALTVTPPPSLSSSSPRQVQFGGGGDGWISFQQFHSWWYSTDCLYLLRRSYDMQHLEQLNDTGAAFGSDAGSEKQEQLLSSAVPRSPSSHTSPSPLMYCRPDLTCYPLDLTWPNIP